MEEPIFDEPQMLRLVNQDAYLKFVYADLMKRGDTPARALEAVFNTNVLEDSVYIDKYVLCAVK